MASVSFSEMQERIMRATTDKAFEHAYRCAKEYEDTLKEGDQVKLSKLDYGVPPICMHCSKLCVDEATKRIRRKLCGRCKSVVYCSKACRAKNWKLPTQLRQNAHKKLCEDNQRHMKRIPELQAVFDQFPWARVEPDGSFNSDLLKARLKVFGRGNAFGYWSVEGGVRDHDAGSSFLQCFFRPTPEEIRAVHASPASAPRTEYVYGHVMLGMEWPTDVSAWKLENETWIPRLAFDDRHPAPERPRSGQIKDWNSWYEWRNLPLESPAALMMDFPLSVYYLLVEVLKVADVSPHHRQDLTVHLIGVEVELNYLPLFSELALLIPNTHISLVVFGAPVYDLVHRARRSCPSSLAATQGSVWSYKAPDQSGGGSIDIKLHSLAKLWSRTVMTQEDKGPDAIVACNAGLFTYPVWQQVMVMAAAYDIPFAVTDYCEQDMDLAVRDRFPRIFARSIAQEAPDAPYAIREDLKKARNHPVTVNPFHRPGQRPFQASRTPNMYNGFAMPVIMPAWKSGLNHTLLYSTFVIFSIGFYMLYSIF